MPVLPPAALVFLAAGPIEAQGQARRSVSLHFESGVRIDGGMTRRWVEALRPRHEPETLARLQQGRRPFTGLETAWCAAIQREALAWCAGIPGLHEPFDDLGLPSDLYILFGNQGANDGFTFGTDTLCLDLRAWGETYGDPALPENRERIHRILSHEYTHLLTKRWLARQPAPMATPLDRAHWELYYEGLGHYHSLSARWRARDGALPPDALRALARHAPVLVDRLNRYAHATPAEERELVKNLSMGPFAEKWGALPIALWLSEGMARDPETLRRFVRGGPQGVPDFIRARLPEPLRQAYARP